MTFVKVCGLTRAEDARLAWELGAAALGFVFHPGSPRALRLEQAARLRAELPPEVFCVGVFVDAPRSLLQEAAEAARLGALQLHGQETPEACAGLAVPVIKALKPAQARDEGLWRAFAQGAAALLLDADHPSLPGGTGRTTDWALGARLAPETRLILAGGLHPGNALRALQQVHPFGLDLSSGLESAPGLKDPTQLRALFQNLSLKGPRPCLTS